MGIEWIRNWWESVDIYAQDWFVLGGLLMVGVVGFAVGCFGLTVIATLEPLVHLGFSFGIAGILGSLFYTMAQIV
jgi:hypothetical protein